MLEMNKTPEGSHAYNNLKRNLPTPSELNTYGVLVYLGYRIITNIKLLAEFVKKKRI